MRIGTAHYDEQTQSIHASIAAPGLVGFSIQLRKVSEPRDRGPAWEIYYEGQRCGALWKRTVRDTGLEFLSGPLESPAFPGGKIEISVWKAKEADRKKEWDITWSPAREESRPATTTVPAPASGGDGEEDEIPF